MAIFFHNVLPRLKKAGYNQLYLMENKILSSTTLNTLRKGQGNLDTKTIDKICMLLDCQPNEFMVYVRSEQPIPPKEINKPSK